MSEPAGRGELLRSPLHERQVALGAKMAEFGGWLMPVEYAGGGVLREHNSVRSTVGIFDVSHLGKAVVRGPGAAAFLDAALTNDLEKIGPGQAQYTLCCDETGGVVDDLIAYLHGEDEVFLVPNAANTAEVVRRLRQTAPPGVDVEDRHRSYAVLAVQGPDSDAVLEAVGLPCGHPYMSFVSTTWKGRPVVVCRTGYTGERGYELVPRAEDAGPLWDALLLAGSGHALLPCGLGARDTLRTEMGYPLHGQDLSPEITPVQARTEWAVGWGKPSFWGRSALLAEREAGARRLLWGLESLERGIPRPHQPVVDADGRRIGEVTSGTFSPSLRKGIGLALLERGVVADMQVAVDVRGRVARMRVVKPPFVTPSAKAD